VEPKPWLILKAYTRSHVIFHWWSQHFRVKSSATLYIDAVPGWRESLERFVEYREHGAQRQRGVAPFAQRADYEQEVRDRRNKKMACLTARM
jgi:hypothetical protein